MVASFICFKLLGYVLDESVFFGTGATGGILTGMPGSMEWHHSPTGKQSESVVYMLLLLQKVFANELYEDRKYIIHHL